MKRYLKYFFVSLPNSAWQLFLILFSFYVVESDSYLIFTSRQRVFLWIIFGIFVIISILQDAFLLRFFDPFQIEQGKEVDKDA